MSTLLTTEPEANFAQCPRAFSLQAQRGQDGHVHQIMLTETDMMSEEFSSFQIRNFVSTVRRSDFSKCWPFRHKILEKCLSAGLKPFLPPFEPPLRGFDSEEADHDISCVRLQQKSPRDVSDEAFEESKQQDSAKADRSDSEVFDERSLAGDKEAKDVIGVDYSDKESVEINHPQEMPALVKSSTAERRLSQGAGVTVPENSRVGSPTNVVTYPDAEHSCINPPESVDRAVDDGKMQQGVSSHAETITCAENILLSTYAEAEAGSVFNITGPSGDVNGSSPRKAQHHKSKLRSLSNDCIVGEVQSNSQKLKSLKAGMTGKAHRDESRIASGRLDVSDQATASCIEHDIMEMPTKNYKNAEDLTFTGINSDILVPQVCPVCLNFTSTSNTALNAHIDHCLESVLPGEKGESRVCRTRIKPRKMRSMTDICATAPARTLEDLEQSPMLWALNDEGLKENSSCTPSWKSGLIRRQPRTSLHRGLAWKARNNSDAEDVLQVSESELQPQLKMSVKENLRTKEHRMVWTASRTPLRDTELELELSCKDPEPFLEELGSPLHESSSLKVSLVRKKKKRQFTSVINSKEVLTSGSHCPSYKEQDDHISFISLSSFDFTPIDTSAEEERRLQQQNRYAKGGGLEAEMLEQQGSVKDSVSRSGKFMVKHCAVHFPSIDTADTGSPNEILRKRKRTQIDNEVVMEDVASSVPSEKPAKNRRAAPKIKSLLTLVAMSRKDKGRDGFEGSDSQKKLCPSHLQEKTNEKGTFSVLNGLQNEHQENDPKQKSYASVPGERCSEADKYVRFRRPEQTSTSTPDNLDSNILPEHVKSLKGVFVSTGRALMEHEMARECPPTFAEEEIPLSISAEKLRNGQGEKIGSLMSSLSNCQARAKDSTCALEKSKITYARTAADDVVGKAPPFTLNFSALRDYGSSHCRSKFEYLRRAFLNVSSRKMCNPNREEALRNTSRAVSFPEQVGKSHVLPSQNLSASNATASVSRFSSMNSRENRGDCVPQLLSGSRKSFFSVNAANVGSVDNVRTSQMTSDSTTTPNCPNSMTMDNQASFANLSPLWSENSQLSAPTCAKFVRKSGPSLKGSEILKNSGNCTLQSSVKHGVQQACFLAGDSFEQVGPNRNESSVGRKDFNILENGSLLGASRKNKYQGQNNTNDNLQRIVRTMGLDSPYQSQQEYFDSRFSSSEPGPVHSPCVHESGPNFDCESNGHDCARLPDLSTERASLSSSLLADISRTMAGSRMNVHDPALQNNFSMGEPPKSSSSCFQCTPKNLNRAREYLNLMPLQAVGNSCHPSASNGTIQPQLLHTALQTMKGHTSTMNSDCVHRIGSNMDVSMKLCNTLSAISPYRVDSLNVRESLLGGELNSNLNDYGSVEYSGDHGVVHIFGSPVFKLMGQNVIVTNSSIKALGMEGSCNQSGPQSFHPSSSITHIGVLPEPGNHYPHKLSQEFFATSRLAACHGDACMQRSHSFLIDSLEVSPHTAQKPGLANPVHLKTLASKEPAISKPQMPQCSLGERSAVLGTAREAIFKKPMVAHAVNKVPAEMFVDVPSNNGNSLSAVQSRGNGAVAQHNDRLFTANCCFLAPNGPLQSQPHTLQSTPPLYMGDAHKLDVTRNAQYRSGTLADIVQSSERSNH